MHGKPKGYNQMLLFFSLHEDLLRIGQRLIQIFLVLFEKSSMLFVSLIFLVFVFVFFLRRRDTCSVLSYALVFARLIQKKSHKKEGCCFYYVKTKEKEDFTIFLVLLFSFVLLYALVFEGIHVLKKNQEDNKKHRIKAAHTSLFPPEYCLLK